jgi:hypothetical protein
MYTREMGCEPSELLYWLPNAMGEDYARTEFWVDGRCLLAPSPEKSISKSLIIITATTLPRRRIALMNLPVTRVEFVFPKDWTSEQIGQSMARFDLYTRRGGG